MAARRLQRALLFLVLLVWPRPVVAQDPPADEPRTREDPAFTLRTSLKSSVLLSRAPDDPALFPERTTAVSFWRLRFEPELRLGPRASGALAYEQRLRVAPHMTGLSGAAILPLEAPAPYRLAQLNWAISTAPGYSWYHEVDRLYVAVDADRIDLTLGRQAIGWGRGVLFGAVDILSPFSPLEADREWRRGVDAVRADVKLADRVSLDMVSAFGEAIDSSVFAGRLRGYAGRLDVEVVGGWRARDVFAGATSSAVVGDAELHGELAVFRLPEALPPPLGNAAEDDDPLVVKAVFGGSYQFALGHGLMTSAEYHYSGFGARQASDVLRLLADPAYRERYLRGDTQILLRHAVAVLGSYEVSPELALAGQWLQNPQDGSGVVSPSATFTIGDKLSVIVSAYVPYGAAPIGLTLRSEYGTTSRSLLLQLRIHV